MVGLMPMCQRPSPPITAPRTRIPAPAARADCDALNVNRITDFRTNAASAINVDTNAHTIASSDREQQHRREVARQRHAQRGLADRQADPQHLADHARGQPERSKCASQGPRSRRAHREDRHEERDDHHRAGCRGCRAEGHGHLPVEFARPRRITSPPSAGSGTSRSATGSIRARRRRSRPASRWFLSSGATRSTTGS